MVVERGEKIYSWLLPKPLLVGTSCWDDKPPKRVNLRVYYQCIKGRFNGRPVRIPANRNPFSQGEVNFAETMFYNELELDDENPAPGTPRAPILEEEEKEEGKGARDLRMHGGARTRGKVDLSLMKVCGT